MTLEQLEQEVGELAREVAALRREIEPLQTYAVVQTTFGMFANHDADFDDIVRLGREYGDQTPGPTSNTAITDLRLKCVQQRGEVRKWLGDQLGVRAFRFSKYLLQNLNLTR